MSQTSSFGLIILRHPWPATILYLMSVLLSLAGTWVFLSDITRHRADVNAAYEVLERLGGHKSAGSTDGKTQGDLSAGSAWLEGPTVTVAGAALLQRISAAVAKVGGTILSSQVLLEGQHGWPGYVGVTASCEVDQASLQKLLYDLEEGMPFLFIEQLMVQAATGSTADENGRMRVVLTVSGQWQGTK